MKFSHDYKMYVQKAERENHSKEEGRQVICRLTDYGQRELGCQIKLRTDFETFFAKTPVFNPHASPIIGVACDVRVEEIEDPHGREICFLDKLVDGLARKSRWTRFCGSDACVSGTVRVATLTPSTGEW